MRFATLALALPVIASANVLPRTGGSGPSNQCNTGQLSCCNSLQSSSSALVSLLAGLLGVVLGPVTGQVGITCTPITVIGAGGNSCSAQPACCTGNTFGGLLTVGCSPVDLNL